MKELLTKSSQKAAPAQSRRLTLINSYRMKEARRLVEAGTYPAQHLWGTWDLPSAWHIAVTDLCLNHVGEKTRILQTFLKHLERFVGDPVQALWAISGRNRGSIVYAANPKTGTLIAVLKRLRLIRVPYVVLVHSYPISPWARWCLGAADAILVFSETIKRRMISDGFTEGQVTVAYWGPDRTWREYFQDTSTNVSDFISAGKTNRDYGTIRALGTEGVLDGNILDGHEVTHYRSGETTVTAGRPSYPEVMKLMAASRVVVIPLRDSSMLSGLTEVSDAIALGKPLVMTKNDWMPIDIEALGIGVWLHDRRPESVQAAIELASLIPSENVVRVADWFNMQSFSNTLNGVLEDLRTGHR
ncbi:hypothetical protein [Arthrobacter sp. HS15c]|uniref:hypothetical protein n=1 Tax=Arthrobacter sp. HS15c TaxID=3230279 RepID=UPI0034655954